MPVLLPGHPEPSAAGEHPIYTRFGWPIPFPREKPIMRTLQQMKFAAEHWQRTRQNLTLRSASDWPYDCVGLIFACRRACIDIDHIYDILKEDGYRQIERKNLEPGDVILYKDRVGKPTHVALVIMVERYRDETLNIKVISKWGLDPEFIHFAENVPELYGKPAEFYTDRINL